MYNYRDIIMYTTLVLRMQIVYGIMKAKVQVLIPYKVIST